MLKNSGNQQIKKNSAYALNFKTVILVNIR